MTPFTLATATSNATVSATSAGSASAATSFRTAGANRRQFRIVSPSTNAIAFLRLGNAAASPTATTSDLPILPGTVEVFTVADDHTHFSVYSTGATVYVTPGMGE